MACVSGFRRIGRIQPWFFRSLLNRSAVWRLMRQPTAARLAGPSNTNKRIKVRSFRADRWVLGSNTNAMHQDTKGLQI